MGLVMRFNQVPGTEPLVKPLLIPLLVLISILPACAEQTPGLEVVVLSDWKLDLIDGQPAGMNATLSLAEPGRISGQAPCNRYVASVQRDGSALAIKAIAATKMACPELHAEGRFFQLLEGMTGIDTPAGQVILTGGDHQMVFVPAP